MMTLTDFTARSLIEKNIKMSLKGKTLRKRASGQNIYEFEKEMSHLVGKPTICIGGNKGADQLRGNREADQRLCFRFSDNTIPLLLKSKISSF